MARSCAIIPKVKNRNGQVVDSKLFKVLAVLPPLTIEVKLQELYLITKSSQFIKELGQPRLTLDENNEPTIRGV